MDVGSKPHTQHESPWWLSWMEETHGMRVIIITIAMTCHCYLVCAVGVVPMLRWFTTVSVTYTGERSSSILVFARHWGLMDALLVLSSTPCSSSSAAMGLFPAIAALFIGY